MLADRFGAPVVVVSFATATVVAAGVALLFARNLVQLDVDREGDIVLDRRSRGRSGPRYRARRVKA